jgi:hypothetical protein
MIDEIALLNRLFQNSRMALSQRLACKNEKFLAAVKKTVDNPNCILCSPMVHVSFDEIGAADDRPMPFQVVIDSKRGFGVLRRDTFDDMLATRGDTADADNIPLATFQPAKDCDLSTQAVIDLESLWLMITMSRNLSLRLAAEAN